MQLLLAGHQQDFPVVDAAGTVVGILARADLVEALARSGPGTPVEAVMRREFARAELGDSLETVFERSSQAGVAMTPVYSGGRLVGLLTPENVGELVMIRRALGLATPAAGKPPLLRGRSSQPRPR